MNGDIKLAPVAEKGLDWHPLLGGEDGAAELAGGTVDGNFAKIEGLPLVDGTGYVGLAISIRFFWPPTGFDCEKIVFVQLVKRETFIDGEKSSKHSFDWKIDVRIPEDQENQMSSEEKELWPKKHPCYQKQHSRIKSGEHSAKVLGDTPGLRIGEISDSGHRIESSWQFKTYIVCCSQFAVLGRIEWGFKIVLGGGNSPVVTLLNQDPTLTDPDSNEPLLLPRVESGADETIREQLGDWMDDQERNCCD